MLPIHSPDRILKAHGRLSKIYEFLETYEKWIASSDGSHCDFSIGNPQNMPMDGFVTALQNATTPQSTDWYAYKTNESYSRDVVKAALQALTGRDYAAEDIFLTNGATGAILVTMNSLIGPGDEVIYSTPPWFFYEGMILNTGGMPVAVPALPDDFDLDVDSIEDAITDRTRFVIVNSPNNPTGKVYPAETMERLAAVLTSASEEYGRPIYLMSDEAYRTVIYDGIEFQSPTNFYPNSIMVYTYGKTLLTPGERIGYIALSPEIEEREALRAVMASSQILCGWAMCSALNQHALQDLQKLSPNVADLQGRRDKLVAGLRDCGYEVAIPEGAFYVTPKTPIADDKAFAEHLAEHGVFCLPGNISHMPGHLRLSVTANVEMIERALPVFAAARSRFTTSTL